MGFEITETETLEFPEYPGLHVVVKLAATFEEFETLERISRDGSGTDRDSAFAEFGSRFIQSWDLTSNGDPLPVEKFPRIPLPIKFAILNQWMGLVRGINAPLAPASSNTPDSLEQSTDEPEK